MAVTAVRGSQRALKIPCVYIVASGVNGTLYIGVTGDVLDRVCIHKQDLVDGFTKRHGVHRLVYYETHETFDMPSAVKNKSRNGVGSGRSGSSSRSTRSGTICSTSFGACGITEPADK